MFRTVSVQASLSLMESRMCEVPTPKVGHDQAEPEERSNVSSSVWNCSAPTRHLGSTLRKFLNSVDSYLMAICPELIIDQILVYRLHEINS